MSCSHRDPRALALWLVALLVSVWPLAAWHELTTTHAVCAEHGEVLDVAHGETGVPGTGPQLVDIDHDEHDPCAFAPLAQPAGGSPGRPVLRIEVLASRPESAPLQGPRPAAIPRYLLAPKQSPPGGSTS